ncbi:MAG: hypothetical protein WCB27_19950 [Thermoguttaceae bacterium]
MRSLLSAEECLAVVSKLSDLLDEPAWSAELFAREAACADNAWGWQEHLHGIIDDLMGAGPSPREVVERGCLPALAQARLLLCELAIRAYSLQHGRNPATLADLVPRYLPKVPKDPFDGGDFVYRLTPKGYELHSRQVDFQGKPISADNPG